MLSTPRKPVSHRLHPVLGSPLKWLGIIRDDSADLTGNSSTNRANVQMVRRSDGRVIPQPLRPSTTRPHRIFTAPLEETRSHPSGMTLTQQPPTTTQATRELSSSGPTMLDVPGSYQMSNASFAAANRRSVAPFKRGRDRRRQSLSRHGSMCSSRTLRRASSVAAITTAAVSELSATTENFEWLLDEFYMILEDPDVPPPSPEEMITIRELERASSKLAFHQALDQEREDAQHWISAPEFDQIVFEDGKRRRLQAKEEEERRRVAEKIEKDRDDWLEAHGAPGFPACRSRSPSPVPSLRTAPIEDGLTAQRAKERSFPFRKRGAPPNTPPKKQPIDARVKAFEQPGTSPSGSSPLKRGPTTFKLTREIDAFERIRSAGVPRCGGGVENDSSTVERPPEVNMRAKLYPSVKPGEHPCDLPHPYRSGPGYPPFTQAGNRWHFTPLHQHFEARPPGRGYDRFSDWLPADHYSHSIHSPSQRCLPPVQRFAECELKWDLLANSEVFNIRFSELPWPVLEDVPDVSFLTKAKVQRFVMHVLRGAMFVDQDDKFRVRHELVKWHPDKFVPKYLVRIHPDDREMVFAGVNKVTNILVELGSEA